MDIRELGANDVIALYALEHARGLRAGTLAPMSGQNMDELASQLEETRYPTHWLGLFDRDALLAHMRVTPGGRARVHHQAKVELGFLLPVKAQAARFVNDALSRLEDYAALQRFALTISASSTQSGPWLQKWLADCGFVKEARLRDGLQTGGGFEDLDLYARIRRALPGPEGIAPNDGVRFEGPLSFSIRPANAADAEGLGIVGAGRNVMEMTMMQPFEGEKRWRTILAANPANGVYAFIADSPEHGIVGSVALLPESGHQRRHAHTLGISVREGFQGAQIGEKMLTHALSFADHELGAHRVGLTVNVENARALRLYERHGFVREGIEVGHYYVRGGYADSLVMGRIRPHA